jgi:hypothetical protein
LQVFSDLQPDAVTAEQTAPRPEAGTLIPELKAPRAAADETAPENPDSAGPAVRCRREGRASHCQPAGVEPAANPAAKSAAGFLPVVL